MEAISDKGQKILLTADNTGKKLPNSDKKKLRFTDNRQSNEILTDNQHLDIQTL